MTLRIAILDDVHQVAHSLADWDRLDADIDFVAEHIAERDQLARRLAPCDVVGLLRERTPFDAELMASLPRLRLLVTAGGRNAAIDLAAAQRAGVTVCGTPSSSHAVAELALGLMLALARGIVAEAEALQQGAWQLGLGRDLHAATLGVVGIGRIGGRVAELGRALGMHVLAWSPHLTAERAAAVGARSVELPTLLGAADVVSVHLRLGDASRGLIGRREIALMRPGALLLNTSRAAIVDTAAVLEALSDGRLGGAALDVFDEEPPGPGHPVRRGHPRLIATPHIGYVTRETYAVFYQGMVEGIAAWAAGAPIRVVI